MGRSTYGSPRWDIMPFIQAFMQNVTIFCFAASYGVALALEVLHLLLARPALRLGGVIFGAAGLLAHTLYIVARTFFAASQPLSLVTPLGSLLFLAWILAVFYFYGSIHHKRVAWGLFALPVVLALIMLGVFAPSMTAPRGSGNFWENLRHLQGEQFWGWVHGTLLLLAAVGICVGCVASIMYLVQVQRLRAKLAPRPGMKMLSLERIESMNRRATLWAFPFLTAGLLVGVALKVSKHEPIIGDWDLKIISGLGLWVVFAVLLYLRYSVHVRGRQAAWWTLIAFVLLVIAMVTQHPFLQGDAP